MAARPRSTAQQSRSVVAVARNVLASWNAATQLAHLTAQVPGRLGLGRVFSGSSVGVMPERRPGGAFAFVAVCAPSSAANDPVILSAPVAGGHVVELRLQGTTGRPEFSVRSPGGIITASAATSIIGAGQVVLVCSYDLSGRVQLWQDGCMVAAASGVGGAIAWEAAPLRIGARSAGVNSFAGSICFAALVDGLIDVVAITALVGSGLASFSGSRVALVDVTDADVTYPLIGVMQMYPLAGIDQPYPLQ